MFDHPAKKPKKLQMTIMRLSRSTGFPAPALTDFAKRGLLPEEEPDGTEAERTFDGLGLLRQVGEIEDAE